jgi:hypothetical protein
LAAVEIVNLPNLPAVLGVLTALIAPALLISACASFIQSTYSRVALNLDRARVVAVTLQHIARADDRAGDRQDLMRELKVTYRRVYLEQQALMLFYAATVMFVTCSLVLGLESITRFLPYWLPVCLGMLGVGLLLAASTLLMLDVRAMVKLMRREVASRTPDPPSMMVHSMSTKRGE